jgi:hypothetical protein
MDLYKVESAYQEFHNNNPRYTFIKQMWGCAFYYDNSFIFTLPLCSEHMGYRITSALNAAFLEGWMQRERELEYERKG